MWRRFPQRLCRETGCPGLLYDREGYGRSSPLNSARTIHYLHDYALNELPEVIKAVIPGRPHILVGHSDGGSIGLIYAAERIPLLNGIVTEAAHVFVETQTIDGIREADEAFGQGKFGALSKYHGEKTHTLFQAWSKTWLSEWFRHWNIEYLLPSITCPILATQGLDDQYGTKHQINAIVAKSAGPAESFLVANCGHAPHREQPEVMIERLSRFIENIK